LSIKCCCKTNWKHSLYVLPICGKLTRALVAHQIFYLLIWFEVGLLRHFAKSCFFTCHIWNMREILVLCREKWNFFNADFHVLGLFMAKKHDLSEKKCSVCHAPLLLQKFVSTLAQSLWKLESWNFGSRSLLGQLDVPHTQNFEIQVPKGSHLREIFWGYVVWAPRTSFHDLKMVLSC
jgi:hypothetical protein